MTHEHHHTRGHVAAHVLTAAVVAVFGLVGVLMNQNGQLDYILARPFHAPVLVAGWAVLALVAVQLVCGMRDCGHDHDPALTCSRLIVLSFPVALFLIGVPNSGFSQDRIRIMLGGDDAISGGFADIADQNGTVTTFRELAESAQDAEGRSRLEGQTAVIEGRYSWIDSRQFTLFRLKMTCCAADTVPLKVRVVLKNGTLSGLDQFHWVRMTGRVQFVTAPNSERYLPVVVVDDAQDIQPIEPLREYD